MIRTQIQLTAKQVKQLRELAALRNVSIAELIRNSVDLFVAAETKTEREAIVARAKAAVGRFASKTDDGGKNHDKYLAEAFATRK